MALVLEAAGGIDDENVDALRSCLLHSIKYDPCRIAAFLARNDRSFDPVAPDHQLLDRGRPEGVTGCQQHSIILFLEPVAELADGGRLARAIDANDQDHVRTRKAPDFQWL